MTNTTASQSKAFRDMHERIARVHEAIAADPKASPKRRAEHAAKAAEVRAFIASL